MLFVDEHHALRRVIGEFVDKEINPHVDAWEEAGLFPAHDLFKKMGDLGFLGITKPVENGGMGLDYSYGLVLAEEMGRVKCGSLPMAVGVQTDMATPALARFGSSALRAEFLSPAIAGDQVACIGVSEPEAGSDVASIKTSAKKDGGDFLINGSKMWITNATQADWVCLLANTSDAPNHKNKSLIVVPLKAPGVSISPRLNKLGMRASDTGQIFFEDVRVPQHHLIGQEGMGFQYQMMQFQEERMYGACSVLKGLEWVIQETVLYAGSRMAFGQPVLANQVVHFTIAELQSEIEALRALVYRACERYVAGEEVTLLASMAKLKAGRLAREVTDRCLQYWGGMGYMWENVVARAFRDMRLVSIGAGTDEMMLGIICKLMRLAPRS